MPDIEIHGVTDFRERTALRGALAGASYVDEITIIDAQTHVHDAAYGRHTKPFLRVAYSRAFEAAYGLDLLTRLGKTGLGVEVIYLERWLPAK